MIFKKEILYLDHVVSEHGIKLEPEKLKVLKDWPVPSCIKDVRTFEGAQDTTYGLSKVLPPVVCSLNDLLVGNTTKKPHKNAPHKFHSNLYGSAFKVVTDNSPLKIYSDIDQA